MPDNINLIVNETIDNVIINPSTTNDIVDVNIYETVSAVDVSITEVVENVSILVDETITSVNIVVDETIDLTTINITDTPTNIAITVNPINTVVNLNKVTSIGGTGNTNLSYTSSPLNGLVNSDTGNSATIPLTDSTNAGLFSPTEKTKLTNITGTNTGDETASTIKSKLGITTLSGSNTGDQDLSSYTTTTYVNTQDALKENYLNNPSVNGFVLSSTIAGVRSWVAQSGGGGITGLGVSGSAQTGATQTLAVGTTGTDFGITSSSNTQTFNLPSASATARGVVTTGTQTFAGLKTFSDGINAGQGSLYYNTIAYLDGTGKLGGLSLGVYPTLSELSFVKGVQGVGIQTQINTKNDLIVAHEILGSTIKGHNLGVPLVSQIATLQAMVSNQNRLTAYYIPYNTTITGIRWYQANQGVYTNTGATYNGIGLYKWSANTLTLVASTTTDDTIWKGVSGSFQSKVLSAPYSATKGIYYIGIMWTTLVTTTTPAIGTGSSYSPNAAASGFMDFSLSGKLNPIVIAVTQLTSPLTPSGLNAVLYSNAVFLY